MRPFGTIAVEYWIGSVIVGFLPVAARTLTEMLYGQSLDAALRLTEELFVASLVMSGSALISFCIEAIRGNLRNATLTSSLLMGGVLSLLCFMIAVIGYGGATSDKSVGTAYTLAIGILPIALSASFLLRVSVASIAARVHVQTGGRGA